jgi:biotin synthase
MDTIRVSAGSAAVLGLKQVKMADRPTTVHLLQYSPRGCAANCAFCVQAKQSTHSRDTLSRVSWPEFPWPQVRSSITAVFDTGAFSRVCVQTVVYPTFFEDLLETVRDIKADQPTLQLSAAIPPLATNAMERLDAAGLDRVGIALDAATPDLFSEIKGAMANGPYTWENHWKAIDAALAVFGPGRVSTHVIVGLGEQAGDMLTILQRLHDAGVTIGLFVFMPVAGTLLEHRSQPPLKYFRQMQLAKYLIDHDLATADLMTIDAETGEIDGWGLDPAEVDAIIRAASGMMFRTSGCPGCNRPYYTTSPRGPKYEYPSPLDQDDVEAAIERLRP